MAKRRSGGNDGPPQLAINLFDVEGIGSGLRTGLLRGKLDLRREALVVVDPDDRDESGVPMTCELLKAAVACDVLRSECRRAGTRSPRLYIRRGGRHWVRLPADVLLTVEINGGVALNPALFPPPVTFVNSPPPTEVV